MPKILQISVPYVITPATLALLSVRSKRLTSEWATLIDGTGATCGISGERIDEYGVGIELWITQILLNKLSSDVEKMSHAELIMTS